MGKQQRHDSCSFDLPPLMVTSPRQLFGTFGAQRLWQLNLQSNHKGFQIKQTKPVIHQKQKLCKMERISDG